MASLQIITRNETHVIPVDTIDRIELVDGKATEQLYTVEPPKADDSEPKTMSDIVSDLFDEITPGKAESAKATARPVDVVALNQAIQRAKIVPTAHPAQAVGPNAITQQKVSVREHTQ